MGLLRRPGGLPGLALDEPVCPVFAVVSHFPGDLDLPDPHSLPFCFLFSASWDPRRSIPQHLVCFSSCHTIPMGYSLLVSKQIPIRSSRAQLPPGAQVYFQSNANRRNRDFKTQALQTTHSRGNQKVHSVCNYLLNCQKTTWQTPRKRRRLPGNILPYRIKCIVSNQVLIRFFKGKF